jgi:hypothetical protein
MQFTIDQHLFDEEVAAQARSVQGAGMFGVDVVANFHGGDSFGEVGEVAIESLVRPVVLMLYEHMAHEGAVFGFDI